MFCAKAPTLVALSLVAGCYLSHQIGDSPPSDAATPDAVVPPDVAECGETGTPDLQIRISVDVAERLPSTTTDGPVLTRVEGSCGRPPIEGVTARRGEVAWRDLDRSCAPYRVTLGLEGAGLRSFYEVRENLCASVTFGRDEPASVERPDEALTTRGIRVDGLAPSERAFISGPQLRFVPRATDISDDITLSYSEADGPFDTYALVFDIDDALYRADDGSERLFVGSVPVRINGLWRGSTIPSHGSSLDASGEEISVGNRPFRLRIGEWPGTDGPRYAEGEVRFHPPHGDALDSPASGTAALLRTDDATLEGEIPVFPDGPWGSFEYRSITAFDDAGAVLATVALDETTTDVTVRDLTARPRPSGDFFSEARVEIAPSDWPRVRVTISDGSRDWIVVYVAPVDLIELEPASLPLPAGLSYEDFAFHPPFAYVEVEYVEPLAPEARMSDQIPTPSVVVPFERVEFVYDLDE